MAEGASDGELRLALERERARTRALRDVGAALSSALELDEVLRLVVDRVSEAMDAERATLYLTSDDGQELWSKVAQGDLVREIRLRVGTGLAGSVAATGECLLVDDAYEDPRFDRSWDARTGFRTRSVLAVPLRSRRGDISGVLQVLNRRGGVFTADDATLLEALASQAAVSVENARLFRSMATQHEELAETHRRLTESVRELHLLYGIAHACRDTRDLVALLGEVLPLAAGAVGADAAALLTRAEGSPTTTLRGGSGLGPAFVPERPLAVPGAFWEPALREGRAVRLPLATQDDTSSGLVDLFGAAPGAALAVPFVCGALRGALVLARRDPDARAFGAADIELASAVAAQLAGALELAERRAVEAREERLATLGQFLSGVLHDLKTPMTVISGCTQLLRQEEDPETRARYADIVARQIQLVTAMTRETLAFARGDRKLWVRKVYLRKFFHDFAEQLTRELAGFGVRLELALADDGVAHFDEAKVQRALLNLARNAAEAIGSRGGTVRLEVGRAPAGALRISLTDDGPGIADAVRGRLFDSFATHGKPDGTGLGLAIVRAIAEDHGGSVTVESRPGRTTFTLELPPDVQRSETHPPEAPRAAPRP